MGKKARSLRGSTPNFLNKSMIITRKFLSHQKKYFPQNSVVQQKFLTAQLTKEIVYQVTFGGSDLRAPFWMRTSLGLIVPDHKRKLKSGCQEVKKRVRFFFFFFFFFTLQSTKQLQCPSNLIEAKHNAACVEALANFCNGFYYPLQVVRLSKTLTLSKISMSKTLRYLKSREKMMI